MSNLNLIRVSNHPLVGTFGVLQWDDARAPFAVTCEDNWRMNETNRSCIPVGSYFCAPVQSPHHGETFEVLNVPGRSHILFHKGNTHEDTKGCIVIGEQFGFIDGLEAVLASGNAFKEFYDRADPNSFILRIRDAF